MIRLFDRDRLNRYSARRRVGSGIGTVIPMRSFEAEGQGRDRKDCMKQFKAAWERFAPDEANLTEFLNMKRKRR